MCTRKLSYNVFVNNSKKNFPLHKAFTACLASCQRHRETLRSTGIGTDPDITVILNYQKCPKTNWTGLSWYRLTSVPVPLTNNKIFSIGSILYSKKMSCRGILLGLPKMDLLVYKYYQYLNSERL